MNLFKKVKQSEKEATVETTQQDISSQVVYDENDLYVKLANCVVNSVSDTKDVDGEPPLHDKLEQENDSGNLPLVDEETQSKIREIEENLKDSPMEEEPVNEGFVNFEDIQNETGENLENQKETENKDTNSVNQTPLENLQKNKGDDNKNEESVLENQKDDDEFLKFKLKLLEENGLTNETVVGVCVTDNEIVKGTNFLIKGNAISGKEYNDCLFTLTNFYQTKIKNATFKNCVFTNALFKKMELENVVFDNCMFRTTHLMSNFEDVYCRDVVFKECILRGLRMQNTFGNLIDMSTCKFGNVNIVCSDIHAFILPKDQQYRYGVILDRPMKGFKKCLPITVSQYVDLINGFKKADDFFYNNINNELFLRETNFMATPNDVEYTCIVDLEIPVGAYVCTVDGIRFRTNMARVTNILPVNGNYITVALSEYDKSTFYKIGELNTIECFDTCPTNEFTNGIYFSMYNPKTDIEEHNE